MRPWLLQATGLCLFAAGCRRAAPADDLLAFVPEDALLLATVESIESVEEAFEEFREFLPASPRRRPGSTLRALLAGEARFADPDAIDPDARVGFVLLEEDHGTVPVWVLPLEAPVDFREEARRGLARGPIAIHGRTALLSSSEDALRRCAPREPSARLRPTLKGDLHVVVDAERLVDPRRNAIDAALRGLERLFIDLPQTISAGSKVPPPPTAKLAEWISRAARHAIFGTERAELALDLGGGRPRLEASARFREGSRAQAALARLPPGPILLDRLPETGDMLLQVATTRGPLPEFAAPMFDWMVDGLAEPSRSELREAWERMGQFPGVGVCAARIAPDGCDLVTILRCEDPQAALRAGQAYWDKLASLEEFFRNAEEAPFRFEVGETRRWEHAGHAVEERRVVQEFRDEDSPMSRAARMWGGENSTICMAVVGDHLITTVGPRSGDSMRRAVDHVSSGGRSAPPPAVRDWLGRIPPEASLLCAMDLGAFLGAANLFLPEPPPVPAPDRPIWFFLDFTARGREARGGIDFDLGGMIEATRPR